MDKGKSIGELWDDNMRDSLETGDPELVKALYPKEEKMDWKDFLDEYIFPVVLILLILGLFLISVVGCSTLDALKAQTANTVEELDEAGADNINAAKICNKNGKILKGGACEK